MNDQANRIPALFGSCVFNEETMQQYIQPAAMDAWRSCLQEGKALTLAVANDVRGSIEAALGDIAEAGRVTGPIAFTAPAAAEGEDEAADVTVAESELGEPPAKKPKK